MPRQGDLTIGDFWGIPKYDEEMSDLKGTSVVLVNNKKAEEFFEKLKSGMKKGKGRTFGGRNPRKPYYKRTVSSS